MAGLSACLGAAKSSGTLAAASSPRSGTWFLGAGLLVALGAMLCGMLLPEGRPEAPSRSLAFRICLALGLLAWGIALTHQASLTSTLGYWFPVLGMLAVGMFPPFAGIRPGRSRPLAQSLWGARAGATDVEAQAEPMDHFEAVPEGSRIEQRQVRFLDRRGGTGIRGVLYLSLEPGQREIECHVGFCPPLDVRPDVVIEACSHPQARVTVAEALWHGMRLEVRLSRDLETMRRLKVTYLAVKPTLAVHEAP